MKSIFSITTIEQINRWSIALPKCALALARPSAPLAYRPNRVQCADEDRSKSVNDLAATPTSKAKEHSML